MLRNSTIKDGLSAARLLRLVIEKYNKMLDRAPPVSTLKYISIACEINFRKNRREMDEEMESLAPPLEDMENVSWRRGGMLIEFPIFIIILAYIV